MTTTNTTSGFWQCAIILVDMNAFFPKVVKIPVFKFLESDFEGKLSWFDVIPGQYIKGVVIKDDNKYRVYVVTLVPESLKVEYSRWPCILIGG